MEFKKVKLSDEVKVYLKALVYHQLNVLNISDPRKTE